MSNIVPYQDMTRMAESMAKSKLFGMKTADEVIALMLIAQANGQHPAAAARDYDIIQGRPSKKAEAMLRDFIGAGGSVAWHRLDDECADATFSHPQGGQVRISWDKARAKVAGLDGRDNWKKWPRQMVRARCISEGVRTVYPVATGGVYTVEEMQDLPVKDISSITRLPTATPAISEERYSDLATQLDNCDNMEDLATIWKDLTPAERKAVASIKDEAKSRIQEESANAEGSE